MTARLSLWYAVSVAAITLNPWLGVVLVDAGLTDAGAATVLLAVPVGRLVGGPVSGWVADRQGPAVVLRLATVLSAALGALLLLPLPAGVAAAVIGGFALTRAPVFPVADATTIALLGRGYGPVRAVGSVAFLACVAVGGWLREEVWALAPVALAVTALVATAAVSWTLPRVNAPASPPTARQALRLLGHPRLWPVFVACALHGASVTAYDSLFSVHVEQLGLPATVTGTALALGVFVEIGVLVAAPRLLTRLGPLPLLTIALATGVPRYVVTGWATDPVWVIAAQALHGIHFGAYWVAGIAWVSEQAPPELRTTAVAMLPAATFGVGSLLGLGAAAVLLRGDGDVALLYRALIGVSATAAAIVWWAGRRGHAES